MICAYFSPDSDGMTFSLKRHQYYGLFVDFCDAFLSSLDSFWQHPFTAEALLVSKWCNAKFLQICSDIETNSSTSWIAWGWVHYQQMFIFGWTIPLTQIPSALVCVYAKNMFTKAFRKEVEIKCCLEHDCSTITKVTEGNVMRAQIQFFYVAKKKAGGNGLAMFPVPGFLTNDSVRKSDLCFMKTLWGCFFSKHLC